MRSSLLLSAALSAIVLASPVVKDKRAEVVVVEDEVFYVTEVVTVTAGMPGPGPPGPPGPPAPPPTPPSTPDVPAAPAAVTPQYGSWPQGPKKHRPAPPPAPAPAPTPYEPAPAPAPAPPPPQPTTTTTEAPAPAPAPASPQPAPAPSSPPASNGSVSPDHQTPIHMHQLEPSNPEPHTPAPALDPVDTASAPKSPAQAPAPDHVPFPALAFDLVVPDCHAESGPVLMKRGNEAKTKQKVAKKTEKKPTKAPTKDKSKASSTAKSSPSPTTTTKPSLVPAKSPKSSSTKSGKGTKTSSKPSGGVATTYPGAVVFHHDLHRLNHSSKGIEWSDSLAATAAKIASTCVYGHSMDVDGGNYGQNIAAGISPQNISRVITEQFYNAEECEFPDSAWGQASPPMDSFKKWGHFSQVVWKATTHVGCATMDCTSQGLVNFNYPGIDAGGKKWFTVCNYAQAGNMAGSYGENIGRPLGHPVASWTDGVKLPFDVSGMP